MEKILNSDVTASIQHTTLVKYAGASGDFNPIHTVVPIAQEAGLKDCIAHGMLIMGIAGRAITNWFPQKNLRKFSVRFSAKTYPGEQLIVTGKIKNEYMENDTPFVNGEVFVHNQEGELKLKGVFESKKS